MLDCDSLESSSSVVLSFTRDSESDCLLEYPGQIESSVDQRSHCWPRFDISQSLVEIVLWRCLIDVACHDWTIVQVERNARTRRKRIDHLVTGRTLDSGEWAAGYSANSYLNRAPALTLTHSVKRFFYPFPDLFDCRYCAQHNQRHNHPINPKRNIAPGNH